MRKPFRSLIEIGVIYVIVSALLDLFLAGYPILLWPGLAFAFAIFGAIIFSNLVVPEPTNRSVAKPTLANASDDLPRIKHLIQLAVQNDDAAAAEAVSERVRSLTFQATAHHLNMPETLLRSMARNEPSSVRAMVGDPSITSALTTITPLVRGGDARALEYCLSRIEEWTN